jgi:transaldolase/glucose-6-phosphate isomerase
VLDSTDPAQVRNCEKAIDVARTLFVVSSKSGTTLEPNVLLAHFFERASSVLGTAEAGRHFVAITDPGSSLEQLALRRGFRNVFHGEPAIGGRFSALSRFGLAPAALIGLPLRPFLLHAQEMARACGPEAPAAANPGLVLGAALGMLAGRGIDKLTLVVSPGLRALGGWLEQLVAESTGKAGRAIIPVDLEPLARPDVYGEDRVVAYVRLESAPERAQDEAVAALEDAGHPVLLARVPDPDCLGAEFFRWEFATAVAGAVLGVNPFDQPDVEASKLETRRLTDDYEASGALPEEEPVLEEGGLRFFSDARNARELERATGGGTGAADWLRAHLGRIRTGDYFALLAYLPMTRENQAALQAIRRRVRDRTRAATCLGFGPRFLHSTGQAYKGGSNSGVFLQLTCDDARDLPVPGQRYSFGVVKAAQARGDFQVLAERGRRALRVHLPANLGQGLAALAAAFERALA